jgi:hypothetical protein
LKRNEAANIRCGVQNNTIKNDLPTYDARKLQLELGSHWRSLFCRIKPLGLFGAGKQVNVLLSSEQYVAAQDMASFQFFPARIVIGDYEMHLDC